MARTAYACAMEQTRKPAAGSARSIAAGAALGLLLAATGLWGSQRHLIFEPVRAASAAPAEVAPAAVDVSIPVQSPGRPVQKLDGWWIPGAHSDSKTVLYLHGNDENVASSVREIAPLRELGYAVLLVDYRGFGRSEGGFPSEATVYEDAQAAWSYLVHERGVDPKALYIYGHSLGGAIAIELARRHPEAAGLIVESSFTSIADMARLQARYALLPVDFFLNQRFESIRKVGALQLPILYLHGTDDELVPFAMGQRLFEASSRSAQLVAIPGGHHDHDASGAAVIRGAVLAFTEGKTLTASAR
jgi:uncharacterized protein